MKLINIFLIILAFQFIKCKADDPRLSFYKIEDFYVAAYKLNANDPASINETNVFSKGDSVLIGLSFKVAYCDSAARVFKYGWQPTRGYYGIVNKIKDFFILAGGIDKYDTLFMSDLTLVTDSFNYIVRKENNLEARENSVSRKGCRAPLDEFIIKVNAGDGCFIHYSLNSTHILYYLNTQRLSNRYTELEFHFQFQDYSLKKNIPIRLE